MSFIITSFLNASFILPAMGRFPLDHQAESSRKKRPRIGIVLREKEDPKGIVIERVIPDSPAEKASLLPGDQFVPIEGKRV